MVGEYLGPDHVIGISVVVECSDAAARFEVRIVGLGGVSVAVCVGGCKGGAEGQVFAGSRGTRRASGSVGVPSMKIQSASASNAVTLPFGDGSQAKRAGREARSVGRTVHWRFVRLPSPG